MPIAPRAAPATTPATPTTRCAGAIQELSRAAEWRASLARDSLRDFIRQYWSIVEPSTKLVWGWHHDVFCDVLEQVTAGKIDHLIINVPPGTSKSLFVSVLWPAWEWANDPSLKYLAASYVDDIAIRDNRRLRSIVTSEQYRRDHWERDPTCIVKLDESQAAKIRFDTTAKGWRIGTSVGGAATGEHPDRIIIDDPLKALSADSDADLDKCIRWVDGTISTRQASKRIAVVVVMQRLHKRDLSGYLLGKGGYDHLMLPMHFDPKRADPRDMRTVPGELLCPGQWDEAKVRRLEIALNQFGASGQLEQDPVPAGGGLFKREWFHMADAAPVRATRCRGWDTATTEGGGDWTVGVKLAHGLDDGMWYVEHVERARLGPGGVNALIRAITILDGPECMAREEQEKGSAGKLVTSARSMSMPGLDFAGTPISGSKVIRANAFRAQCEAGNVRVVRGVWNEAYLDVMTSFPVGSHDDDVDATSCAFNALVELNKYGGLGLTW